MVILPKKTKLKRHQKMSVLESRIKNRGNEHIDKILAKFSKEYGVTVRHLRESYIRILLLSESIEPSDFEDSVLITKKFLTRLKVSQKEKGEKAT